MWGRFVPRQLESIYREDSPEISIFKTNRINDHIRHQNRRKYSEEMPFLPESLFPPKNKNKDLSSIEDVEEPSKSANPSGSPSSANLVNSENPGHSTDPMNFNGIDPKTKKISRKDLKAKRRVYRNRQLNKVILKKKSS